MNIAHKIVAGLFLIWAFYAVFRLLVFTVLAFTGLPFVVADLLRGF